MRPKRIDEELSVDKPCGFCQVRNRGVCVECCDKTTKDILKRLEGIELKAVQVKAIVDRQRLYAVRFNELLGILSRSMASKSFLRYLVDEDF